MIIVFAKNTGKIACVYNFLPPGQFEDGLDHIEVKDGEWNMLMQLSHLVDAETGTLVMDPAYAFEAEWRAIRQQRNQLLSDTDYLVMPDYPITDECREALVAYRQALRDMTSADTPDAVVWPVKPAIVMKSSASS